MVFTLYTYVVKAAYKVVSCVTAAYNGKFYHEADTYSLPLTARGSHTSVGSTYCEKEATCVRCIVYLHIMPLSHICGPHKHENNLYV